MRTKEVLMLRDRLALLKEEVATAEREYAHQLYPIGTKVRATVGGNTFIGHVSNASMISTGTVYFEVSKPKKDGTARAKPIPLGWLFTVDQLEVLE